MYMWKEIESNIIKNELFTKKQSLLLAISGGVDSVVLAHLLKEGKYDFALAHCNFKLRGKDSDKDEKFCKELAKESGVKFFSKKFNTKEYSAKNKLSIQMAARELRYNWFKKLLKDEKFDRLVTAHHAGDVAETVFINLLRGTGIKGLKGISAKNGNIVRPLLTVSKANIEQYAKNKKIKFRADKSNEEDKYGRNYLRLKVIPLLKKINPGLERTFIKNCSRFSEEAGIVNDYLERRKTELLRREKDFFSIDLATLRTEKYHGTLLNYLLVDFGFNETQQQNILDSVIKNGTEARHFYSPSHKLHIEKSKLVIVPKNETIKSEIKIASLKELKKELHFKISRVKKTGPAKRTELFLSENKLIFPLTIRTRRTGEKFKPFGMAGYKLLSDFLKDIKLSTPEKEKVRLLVNGNEQIIWMIGYRSDERYRVDVKEKKIIKLSLPE